MSNDRKDLQDIAEVTEWVFPDVTNDVFESDVFNPLMNIDATPDNNKIEEIENKQVQSKEALTIENLIGEQEKLVAEYQNKIGIINNIIEKLKNPLAMIDDEIIELIHDIIKNAIKKIIFKEISIDSQLIVNIIAELKSLMQNQKQIMNIYLSKSDYEHIEADKSSLQDMICIDPAFAVGDILIKSNLTEIRALLDERIDQVLRVEHG